METFDVGKLLTRIGALLIIIAGFVQIGEYALYIAIDFLNYGYTGIWMVIWLSTGVVAVIFGFLLLFFFLRMVDANRVTAAILIIIFGILGAVFAWEWAIIGGVGAVLCLVGAILFFVESETGGA
jgi:hypothetical protein